MTAWAAGRAPGARFLSRALARAAACALAAGAAAACPSCSPADPQRPRIGVIQKSSDDPLCAGSRAPMEAAAAGKADLFFSDSRSRPAAQEAAFGALAARKAQAIAIYPVDEISARAIVIAAKEKGVPLVFFGSRPADDSMRSWDKVFYVGAADQDAGQAQAEILAARWKADPSADRDRDGRMRILVLSAESGRLRAQRRAEQLVKGLASAGVEADEVDEEGAGVGREAARKKMAAVFARLGDGIEAVACDDDAAALGAIDACEAAGLYKGGRRLPIVGVCDSGSTRAIAGELASGKLAGTAFLDAAAVGGTAIALALALAEGEDPARAGLPIQDAKFVRITYRALTGKDAQASR